MKEENVPRIAGVFKKLAFSRENNESNFSITKNRDLMSFLEKSSSPFRESNLTIDLVFYPLQLNPTSSHVK